MALPVPPFKRTEQPASIPLFASACCEARDDETPEASAAPSRRRLVDLDGHLHCSVIGTCLGTAELRRLMARHLDVDDADDLEVHHEAVRLVGDRGAVAKALQKALDHRHDAALARVARLGGAAALLDYWQDALRVGQVPGAYWAVLMHRDADSAVTSKVFGDVHMLSHAVGAANRADLRRLAALEDENAQMLQELHGLRVRLQAASAERERGSQAATVVAQVVPSSRDATLPAQLADAAASAAAEAALQRERSARWERAALTAQAAAVRAQAELHDASARVATLEAELALLESELQPAADEAPSIADQVRGRRILYVGGRPGSTSAIRDLVTRHGGAFRSHDGGLEDRKGLLAPAVASADVVLFPVDCIDHDSAGTLKRLCARHRVPFIPLRSAGVASFAAALAQALPAT